MRAFLFGLALIYGAATLGVILTDEASRPENPWVLSFVLSTFVVPVAAAWATAELMVLLFRRPTLAPGRTTVLRRVIRGVIAGLLGVLATIILVAVANISWEDWYTTAAAAAATSALVVLIGRRAKLAHLCIACGYDLRGLTQAAAGRCPECGHCHPTSPSSVPLAA